MGGEPNQEKKTKKVAPAQLFFARKHRMPEKKAPPPRRNDMKEKDPKKNGAFRKERAGFGFSKKVMHLLLSRV